LSYLHGIYGEQVPTTDALPPAGVTTLPVYIGTAPVDQVDDPTKVIKTPILVNSFDEAKDKLGYSDDWETYTLCEAMYAHFKNRIQPIGPIVLINVLDPNSGEAVSYDDVIEGLSTVRLVYQTHNMIPTIIAAPGWSQIKAVKEAMITASQKINGHWDALVVADIDTTEATTISAATNWRTTNGYTDINMKLGWPMAESAGRKFHASTLMALRMQQTDYANDNVPFVSPSNKPVDITSTVLKDGTVIQFDETEANELNKSGITTFNFRGGVWVLWGPHCANFEEGAEIDPKDVFDASIRMMQYLSNSFQARYMLDVDGPLNRSVVDTILNDSNAWLNSMAADGKILYGSVTFNETSNPTSSIVEGDFVFDIRTTTTPVAKSLTFKLQYTTQGINTLFGGES
jgi:phage tail sheath protein FI